jgi:predicted permease
MVSLFGDFRYGLRILARNPGFTTVAVLTLALGIGANTAVFSVLNAVLLRPLPGIADPSRLVAFYRSQKADAFDTMGYPDYADYRDRNQSLSGLAAHSPAALSFSYATAERVRGDAVSGNYFEVLGVKPALGRLLLPEDDSGSRAVAVLSYGLWQRKFGGDPNVMGARIALNGFPFTIVGVARKEFSGTVTGGSFDLWVPLSTQPQTMPRLSAGILRDRSAGWLWVFGRLKPGVGFQEAEAEMKTIAGQLAQEYPMSNAGRSINLVRGVGLYPDAREEVSGLLGLLSAAVALLLLIACANVAGLFMVRASGRQREIAVRLAVGAGRGRIIRQLLAEGILLSLIAGALGLFLSGWVTELILSFRLPAMGFRRLDVGVDGRVLGFTMVASVTIGLLFALMPAVQSLRLDLTGALKNGAPGGGFRRSRWRTALVVAQVAVSFILLAGAGLLLRSLYRIVTSDPGFETRNIAMTSIDLTVHRYSEERGEALYRRLLERLSAVPGVASASLAWTVPPQDLSGRASIFFPGQEPPQDVLRLKEFEIGLRVDIDPIAPHYFRTLGIPLIAGRDFTEQDRVGAPGVVILSRKLAEWLWPGQTSVGKRISWPTLHGPPRAPVEVIGVAADTKYRTLTGEAPLLMYAPVLQNYDGRITVVVRTAGDPRGAIADLQRVLSDADKDLAGFAPQTMSEHIAESLWQQRMAASWIGAFSLMALIVAAVGLYAVIAQSVAQRTREVGIRMALGAAPGSVAGLVVREGILLAVAGLVIGVPVALGFAGVVRRSVAGVSDMEPVSFAGIALLLAAVMLAACWVPAHRAARVNPIEALRCE